MAWTVSEWNSASYFWHKAPIPSTGFKLPISLFANMSETNVFGPCFNNDSSSFKSISPCSFTDRYAASTSPRSTINSTGWPTAWCSIVVVIIRFTPRSRTLQNRAILSASVPPEVKKISLGCAPIVCAMRLRTTSTSTLAPRPLICVEDGFPKFSIIRIISSLTRGSSGVVAALSKNITPMVVL